VQEIVDEGIAKNSRSTLLRHWTQEDLL
jgi:hypothetical protein